MDGSRGQSTYTPPQTPYQSVRGSVQIPEHVKDLLPRRWQKVGDVLVLRLPSELEPYRREVGAAYGHALRAKAVLDRMDGAQGSWRTPSVRRLWGDETETVHKEDDIRYRLDPTRVMFSFGNMGERKRMGRVVETGEDVVDMFAGIGYFALPMALHGRARKVVACEINPTAFRYLQENVRMNHASAIEPVLGDCREVAPDNAADRVVLGYLQDTHQFLPKALRVLRGRGWIHYHEGCPDRAARRLVTHLKSAARDAGRKVERVRGRRVKAYAPGVSHWVLDAYITQEQPRSTRWP